MKREVEPRVRASDVAAAIRHRVQPDEEGAGESITMIAERANTSIDTVYRVMREKWQTISLDLADRIMVAVGRHISEAELVWPDDKVE